MGRVDRVLEEKTNEANLGLRARTTCRKEAGISLLENKINQVAGIGARLSLWMDGWMHGCINGWVDG